MTFQLRNKHRKEETRAQHNAQHHRERKMLRRSAGALKKDQPKAKFWMGKRVS